MFHTIFKKEGVSRHLSAPLALEREQFLLYLQQRGTGRICLRIYASRLNQIVRFLGLTKLRDVMLTEIQQAARRWAGYQGPHRHCCAGPLSQPTFTWLAKRWLRFHGKLTLPLRRVYFSRELNDYREFMISELGLAPSTIQSRIQHTRCFLEWVWRSRRARNLSTLSLEHTDHYIAMRSRQWGIVSLASCSVALRAFFRYAERSHLCAAGIAAGIKLPRARQKSSSPLGPEWSGVERMLRATERRTPVDLRARAILLLLSVYGLRCGEIVRLLLSDFDWPNRIFTVRRSKGGGYQQFPICPKLGTAVLAYLRESRPKSLCPHLFISFHPPFGPMHPSSIYEIVSHRMNRLRIRSSRTGPHALRHACATELLRRGATPREIADFLGHHNCRSVAIYAKFDLQSLREVSALDLPGAL